MEATKDTSPAARLAFLAGGAVSGIVGGGVSSFLLLYYNLALGVSAGLVSTALAVALLFDGVSDPVVGYVSDNLRSPWGRRLPFMYFSILPIALLVYALWNPPVEMLGPNLLFVYLLVVIVFLRITMTLFDVPFNALLPEITTNYDERTRLSFYRVCATWMLVTLLSIVLYGYWLRPTEEFPDGLLNASGYAEMGLVSAVIVLVLMLLTTHLLRKEVAFSDIPQKTQTSRLQIAIRDVLSVWLESKLRPLISANVLIGFSFSAYGTLLTYIYAYFWDLSMIQISGLAMVWGVGIALGFMVAPLTFRGRDKRKVALTLLVLLGLTEACAPVLNLIGWFPSSNSQLYYPLLLGFAAADMCIYVLLTSMLASMFADIVEVRELASGRKEEGSIYSAQMLIGKVSSAGGIWIAGLVLVVIGFPEGGEGVTAEISRDLIMSYIAIVAVCYTVAAYALQCFRIDRQTHHEHLKQLRERNEGPDQTAAELGQRLNGA